MTDSRSESVDSDGPARHEEATRPQKSGSSSPNSCRVYTLQELTAMKESPLSQLWPKYLDETFKNQRGFWDPEKWFQSFLGPAEEKIRNASDRPGSGFANPREAIKKRDPKERIKSDQNDIVLSPQRGSFTTGCQVSTANGAVNVNGESKKDDVSLRPDTTRRVGSGRILARDRDIDDIERDNGGRRYERREDRFEPRGFRRDFGGGQDDRTNRRLETEGHDSRPHREALDKPKRDRDDVRSGRNAGGEGWYPRRDERDDFSHGSRRGHGEQRAGLYGEDRHYRRRHGESGTWKQESDEPEWMSATVDQNELMELRGFEDSPEKDDPDPLQKFKIEMKEKEMKLKMAKSEELGEAAKRVTAKIETESLTNVGQDFDIEDFLKISVIPGFSNILSDDAINLDNGQSEATGGRFSQFFRPSNQSAQNPIKIAAAPSVRIPSPGDPSAYFAPISPAAKTASDPQHSNSILSMLIENSQGNASIDNSGAPVPSLAELRGKMVHSVDEVEADIKQMVNVQDGLQRPTQPFTQQKQHQPTQIEMSPFEKFAALVGGKSEPLPPAVQSTNIVIPNVELGGRSLIKPSPIPANAPTEQEILAGMIGPKLNAPAIGASFRQTHQVGLHHLTMPELLTAIYNAPFNPEALKRPEAQTLQAALNSNHVKLEVLVEHLATGSMPSLQREILLNVLKFAQIQGRLGPFPSGHQGRNPQPRHLIPSPHQQENSGFLQHQKLYQQHVMPSVISSAHVVTTSHNQRGQSPFEMNSYHHQFLQNALIKKKREEEKLRLRQVDSQAEISVTSSKVRSTDSPLTFTPTAVMKKIAAERRDSDPAFAKFQGLDIKVSKNSGIDAIDSLQLPFHRSSPFSQAETASLAQPSLLGGSDVVHIQNQVLALQQHQLRMQAKHTMQRGPFPTVLEHQRVYPSQQPRLFQPMGQGHYGREGMGIQQSPLVQPQLYSPQDQQQTSGLLQFFSPEVLAQAGSVSQLPPLPTQKVLTLEELERQSSAVTIQ